MEHKYSSISLFPFIRRAQIKDELNENYKLFRDAPQPLTIEILILFRDCVS